jgi:hypothetical protein
MRKIIESTLVSLDGAFSGQTQAADREGPRYLRHGLLSDSLLENNLLDELKLWIHPLLMGRSELRLREGKETRLRVVATRTLKTGVIVATYQPAQP